MHILYLHQYFVPPDGSGGTRSFEMARRFVRSGHKVTVITSSAFFPSNYIFNKKLSELKIDGISLKVIRVAYSNKLSYIKRIFSFVNFAIRAIRQVLKIDNVDIIFATSTPLTIALPGIAAKKKFKTPMVFEVRDLWPELPIAIGALKRPSSKWMAKYLEKLAYNNSDHIIALSPGIKEGIISAGYHPERITVIPNGCDIELFQASENPSQDFIAKYPFLQGTSLITYAGTFGLINGIDYLIDVAAAMLNIDSSVRFLIAGDGKQRKQIYQYAQANGVLETNLWIIPPVSKKEMPQILSATTVATSLFINLPEMWNNSANKFFDALAAGRPVMVNYKGWQADILKKTGAGLAVPPSEPMTAAKELYAFLNDKEQLKKARQAAMLLADTEFNRDKLAEKTQQVLENVLNEKSR
jgi:glycosyltransferase involved in cell wall biosynthesis